MTGKLAIAPASSFEVDRVIAVHVAIHRRARIEGEERLQRLIGFLLKLPVTYSPRP